MTNILLVDDDKHFASAAKTLLAVDSNSVDTAGSIAEARRALREKYFDLMFVDIKLPDGNGLEIVESGGPPAVAITGQPSINTAISCVRGPFVDYLVKPLDRARLMETVNSVRRTLPRPARQPEQRSERIIARSKRMREVVDAIERYVGNNNNVLLTGETGTGKDLVARALHRKRNKDAPFVAINCGAVPSELIASELFGHEKGSFTDATGRRVGAFEQAAGGTLFLDEVGELPLGEQTVLLRALESRKITRVGGTQQIDVDARVIAATNQDLGGLVKQGRFRKDLYYRLLVLPITLPPLRERTEDIDALVRVYLDEFSQTYGTPPLIAASVLDKFRNYSWPGNVRELRNTLLRAAIISHPGEVIENAPLGMSQVGNVGQLDEQLRPGMSLRNMEKKLILATVEHFRGNRSDSARSLGISKKTLYNRLKKYSDDEVFCQRRPPLHD